MLYNINTLKSNVNVTYKQISNKLCTVCISHYNQQYSLIINAKTREKKKKKNYLNTSIPHIFNKCL